MLIYSFFAQCDIYNLLFEQSLLVGYLIDGLLNRHYIDVWKCIVVLMCLYSDYFQQPMRTLLVQLTVLCFYLVTLNRVWKS